MLNRVAKLMLRLAPALILSASTAGIVAATLVGCIDFSDAFPDPNNTNTNSNTNTNTNGSNANSNSNSNSNANTNSNNGGTIGNFNQNGSSGVVPDTGGVGVPVANQNTNGNNNTNNNTNDNSSNGNTNTNGNSNDNTNSGGGATIPTAIETIAIARSGDAVPGQPAGVAFTEFGNPVIDSKGRVAFWALYAGSGAAGAGGLYVYQNGALVKVLDDNPASTGVVPGRSASDYFGKFVKSGSFDPLTQDVIWAGGDRLLFVSISSGSGTSRGFYRWRATDANFARIADLEQIAALYPDATSGGFIPNFGTPGVSDNGFAIFGLDYRYFTRPPGSTLISGSAILVSNGTTVSLVRDTNLSETTPGDVPGRSADAYFNRLTPLTTVNGDGDMLFEGRFFDPDATRGMYLYRYDDDVLQRAIDATTGVTWPGLPTGTQVNPSGSSGFIFANGPLGHIAVDTQLSVSGATRDAVILFDFDTSAWYEMTGPGGAPATDLLSGVSDDAQIVVLSGARPYIVGGGQRVQLDATLPTELVGVSFTWLNTGGSINNNRRAVVSYSRDTKTALAFWTGTQLLVVADASGGKPAGIANTSTITDPRRDRVGRSGLLNDRDEIVFRATLAAGGQAVYLSRAK